MLVCCFARCRRDVHLLGLLLRQAPLLHVFGGGRSAGVARALVRVAEGKRSRDYFDPDADESVRWQLEGVV